MHLPIPLPVLYAGLAGVFLALIVATATNGWQLRVFFLLALRLAIGWHFLFEGLHKLHSFTLGDEEKAFTSARYFSAGEGPVADMMRKRYIGDPERVYAERLEKKNAPATEQFKKLTVAEQAKFCPDAVAALLDGTQDAAIAALNAGKDKAAQDKAKAEGEAKTAGDELTKAEATKDAAKIATAKQKADAAKKKVDDLTKAIQGSDDALAQLAKDKAAGFERQKAQYAAWVYGVDKREAKVNMVTGDIPMTADQRLSAISLVQRELDALAAREAEGLGSGYGLETERRKKLQTDLSKAKKDLADDTDKFVAELRKEAGLPPLEAAEKEIKRLDKLAAWGITAIGAGLLLGLFTKLWCVAGFGFLVTVYLSSPPWPWLPPQPPSEGNPLFINRNAIEALAMLVILVHPTGKWLGLDALLCRLIFGPEKVPPKAA